MPDGSGTGELKVSGSRFVGQVHPVQSDADATAILAKIRRSMHDATHHCFAWRIGEDVLATRFSDDGEPNGTAGPPILRRIESAALTNTLVVVTRYYGGTKLGTGGLIRAYGEAAKLAIQSCAISKRVIERLFSVEFDYDDTSIAMHMIAKFDARIVDTQYGDKTKIVFAVRRSMATRVVPAFRENSAGRVSPEVLNQTG